MGTQDEKTPPSGLSDLARIDLTSGSPYDLFTEWHEEARKFSSGLPNAFCLATVSKDLKVTARHVMLRRLDQDGFVLVTDGRTQKARDLVDVPSASICFLWSYINEKNNHMNRQVRIEGTVKMLSKEDCEQIYETEPLYCKIRSNICFPGQKINWDEQKQKHDQVLKKVQNGEMSLHPCHHILSDTNSTQK